MVEGENPHSRPVSAPGDPCNIGTLQAQPESLTESAPRRQCELCPGAQPGMQRQGPVDAHLQALGPVGGMTQRANHCLHALQGRCCLRIAVRRGKDITLAMGHGQADGRFESVDAKADAAEGAPERGVRIEKAKVQPSKSAHRHGRRARTFLTATAVRVAPGSDRVGGGLGRLHRQVGAAYSRARILAYGYLPLVCRVAIIAATGSTSRASRPWWAGAWT